MILLTLLMLTGWEVLGNMAMFVVAPVPTLTKNPNTSFIGESVAANNKQWTAQSRKSLQVCGAASRQPHVASTLPEDWTLHTGRILLHVCMYKMWKLEVQVCAAAA